MARRSRARTALLAVALALTAGCRTPAPIAGKPGTALDVCAERLHEVSGQLLLHYCANGRLPGSTPELRALGAPIMCPVSGREYVYRPDGVPMPEDRGRLVLYDPAPSHRNGRWGVVVLKVTPGAPITTRVVWLPETLARDILR